MGWRIGTEAIALGAFVTWREAEGFWNKWRKERMCTLVPVIDIRLQVELAFVVDGKRCGDLFAGVPVWGCGF